MPLVAGSLVLLARVLRLPPRQRSLDVKTAGICLSSLFNDGEQTEERKDEGVVVPLDRRISRFLSTQTGPYRPAPASSSLEPEFCLQETGVRMLQSG
jgi:hypothetical protein